MRVKLLVGFAAHPDSLAPGDEVEFSQDEAMRLIREGFAVPAGKKIERAVKAPVETRKRKK